MKINKNGRQPLKKGRRPKTKQRQPQKKQMMTSKKTKSTKINLIGCDTIVNQPSQDRRLGGWVVLVG